MNPHEMAELLLYDFYLRSQQEEEVIYQKGRRFAHASDRVLEANFNMYTGKIQ